MRILNVVFATSSSPSVEWVIMGLALSRVKDRTRVRVAIYTESGLDCRLKKGSMEGNQARARARARARYRARAGARARARPTATVRVTARVTARDTARDTARVTARVIGLRLGFMRVLVLTEEVVPRHDEQLGVG